MRNIALKLRYDGSAYHGWQVQKTEVTVAGTLERALAKTCGHEVKVTGCGRTDAGVHALSYCANFRTGARIPLAKLPLAVNSRLPMDIAVTNACEAPESFNAIGSCAKKEYIYKILNSRLRDPFVEKRVCFFPSPLDTGLMARAAAAFEGTHDFAAFQKTGSNLKGTVRTVNFFDVAEWDCGIIEITVNGNAFLYNQVRNMCGLLAEVGKGKYKACDVRQALDGVKLKYKTLPAKGLTLERVFYNDLDNGN